MKKDLPVDIHVLILALAAVLFMTEIFLYAWKQITLPDALLPFALIVMLLVAMGLIAVIIYQALTIEESAMRRASRMAESMLVYSHELFSELYRSSPVPYILVDASGKIESANMAAARLFNVKGDALNGISIFECIRAKDDTKSALIREYYERGKFINDLEVQITCIDAMEKWVLMSLFSFFDAKGVKKGFLTLVDVTKQKMVDRAKTEFVSLASHQLRTPISAMKWNMELLGTATTEPMNGVQSAYMEKINHGLERMDLLVRDFLSASKLELGTLTVEKTTLEIIPFLQNMVQEYTEEATQKGVAIETDWGNGRGIIQTDAHLLQMAISNLIGNALKYTNQGGKITVRTTQTAHTFTIEVRDTGIGIPEEDQKMIFSKMYRASNAQTQVSEGTGLGLYIVKEILTLLKGTITFTSHVGVGTTFTVVLQK